MAEALTTLTSVLPESPSDPSMKTYDSTLYPVHNMVGLLMLKAHDLEGAEELRRRLRALAVGEAPGSYLRNLLGWLETRLAQNTFNYLKLA